MNAALVLARPGGTRRSRHSPKGSPGRRAGQRGLTSFDMRKRWTAAGMLEAEQQFRRIIGYRDLAKLVTAIDRDAALPRPTDIEPTEAAEAITV